MHKLVKTAYGQFPLRVNYTGARHGELIVGDTVILRGTQSKVIKAFDNMSSGHLVNMLKEKGVISE